MFFDSHGLCQGVDFTVGSKVLISIDGKRIAKIAAEKSGFGLVVQYKNFFHADNRKGDGIYIDMTHVDPISDLRNCSGFEFSKVDGIRVGLHEKDDSIGIIAAYIDKKLYLYEISSIDKDGYLEKKLTIHDEGK